MAKLNAYYAKRFAGGCTGERAKEPVCIESVQFCDVDGDGLEEAIVNGSSCVSGTGGPDIHQVLKFKADGTIINISPPEQKSMGAPDTFNGQPIFDCLIGGINHDISFKNGILYRIYRDSSGKPEPLILQFKWINGKFKLINVIKNGLTLRSTRTPPALSSALSLHLASSAPLIASAQAGPVSFIR
jgi:hypothetical protein